MSAILVGCDPEVFVKRNGIFQSAHGLIRGDKKNPFKVRRGAVQVDGMALEFNIDPAATADEFVVNVNDVLGQLKLMVPDYEVVAVPVAKFTKEYLKAQPDEAKELGCDPDFNAYTGLANEKPDGDRPMRTASGHVHIGWTSEQDVTSPDAIGDAQIVAKTMDAYLGLGSLLFDKDQERRSMYGKAGCYRVKPYGMEYRTLSNAWLNSEELMRWVFKQVQFGMKALKEGRTQFLEHEREIRKAIDRGDALTADMYMNHLGIRKPPVEVK